MLLPDERAALVNYCLKMQADDLTVGTSGNLSVRSGDLVAITPSGVNYDDLTPEAICVIDLDGDGGGGRPRAVVRGADAHLGVPGARTPERSCTPTRCTAPPCR